MMRDTSRNSKFQVSLSKSLKCATPAALSKLVEEVKSTGSVFPNDTFSISSKTCEDFLHAWRKNLDGASTSESFLEILRLIAQDAENIQFLLALRFDEVVSKLFELTLGNFETSTSSASKKSAAHVVAIKDFLHICDVLQSLASIGGAASKKYLLLKLGAAFVRTVLQSGIHFLLRRSAAECVCCLLDCDVGDDATALVELFAQELSALGVALSVAGDYLLQSHIVELVYRVVFLAPNQANLLVKNFCRGISSRGSKSLVQAFCSNICSPENEATHILDRARGFLNEVNKSVSQSPSVRSYLASGLTFPKQALKIANAWVDFGHHCFVLSTPTNAASAPLLVSIDYSQVSCVRASRSTNTLYFDFDDKLENLLSNGILLQSESSLAVHLRPDDLQNSMKYLAGWVKLTEDANIRAEWAAIKEAVAKQRKVSFVSSKSFLTMCQDEKKQFWEDIECTQSSPTRGSACKKIAKLQLTEATPPKPTLSANAANDRTPAHITECSTAQRADLPTPLKDNCTPPKGVTTTRTEQLESGTKNTQSKDAPALISHDSTPQRLESKSNSSVANTLQWLTDDSEVNKSEQDGKTPQPNQADQDDMFPKQTSSLFKETSKSKSARKVASKLEPKALRQKPKTARPSKKQKTNVDEPQDKDEGDHPIPAMASSADTGGAHASVSATSDVIIRKVKKRKSFGPDPKLLDNQKCTAALVSQQLSEGSQYPFYGEHHPQAKSSSSMTLLKLVGGIDAVDKEISNQSSPTLCSPSSSILQKRASGQEFSSPNFYQLGAPNRQLSPVHQPSSPTLSEPCQNTEFDDFPLPEKSDNALYRLLQGENEEDRTLLLLSYLQTSRAKKRQQARARLNRLAEDSKHQLNTYQESLLTTLNASAETIAEAAYHDLQSLQAEFEEWVAVAQEATNELSRQTTLLGTRSSKLNTALHKLSKPQTSLHSKAFQESLKFGRTLMLELSKRLCSS